VSGDLSVDYAALRQKCAESVYASQSLGGVSAEHLLEIFCVTRNIPNEFSTEGVLANLNTIMWWLINHEDSEGKLFLCIFLILPQT
jgi:hypothetical protein